MSKQDKCKLNTDTVMKSNMPNYLKSILIQMMVEESDRNR